jgi:hypothetical protein
MDARVLGFGRLTLPIGGLVGIGGILGWSGEQQSKWADRAERDERERHQPGLAQRQLVENRVRFSRIGEVHDEHDPALILLEVPLVDLAIEIQTHARPMPLPKPAQPQG